MGGLRRQGQRQDGPPVYLWRLIRLVAVFVLSGLLLSRGGGGGGSPSSSSSNPPPGNFTLSVSPTSVTLQPGTWASASVSAAGTNGFSAGVSVRINSLPAGVTVSPTAI